VTTNLKDLHVLAIGEPTRVIEALVRGLASRGATMSVIRRDTGESGEVASIALATALDETEATAGPIDVMVYVLGPVIPGPLIDSDLSHKESSLHVLSEMIDTVQVTGARMLKRGAGRIIVVTSVLGVRGVANTSLEAAVSAGAQGFVRSLALEWVREGVIVNTVGIGVLNDHNDSPDDLDVGARRYSPVRRLSEPEDVVGVVAYLASPLAGYVVGETILVDGGLSAHA
jgi:NAD(P)-dependent dehydrogenase (short-subunit alcohol dehydrogenase family)